VIRTDRSDSVDLPQTPNRIELSSGDFDRMVFAKFERFSPSLVH
jgi:hypothetical protein